MPIQFKEMLKKLLEKLKLPPTRYECENFGSNLLPVFIMKIRFEDKHGNHEPYEVEAYAKKRLRTMLHYV